MSARKLFLCFILFGLQSLWVKAALADVSTSGYWVGIMPTYSFSEKHSVTLQAEARRQGDKSFVLIRPSYHYQALKWANVGLGWDHFTTDQTEVRHWAEFNLKSGRSLSIQKLHLRYRQEFRNLSGVKSSGTRSRIMIMSQFDLSKAHKLEIFVFDEVFYTQRSFAGDQNFFDRNWLGFRIRKNYRKFFVDLGGFWERVFNSQKSQGFIGILSLGGSFD